MRDVVIIQACVWNREIGCQNEELGAGAEASTTKDAQIS